MKEPICSIERDTRSSSKCEEEEEEDDNEKEEEEEGDRTETRGGCVGGVVNVEEEEEGGCAGGCKGVDVEEECAEIEDVSVGR